MLDVRDRPRFTADEATRIVRQKYGLEVEAKSLPSERDQNFVLLGQGRPRWVLKIANKGEERAVLELQNEALCWIEERDSSLEVPRVLPGTGGEKIAQVEDADGVKYMTRLVTYLDGLPLAKMVPHSSQLLFEVGEYLGRLDEALRDFTNPSAQRLLKWSVMQASEILGQNLAHIGDPNRRSIVKTYVEKFERNVWPLLGELRSGVIHNDANDYNVLVRQNASGKQAIAGLLDFGDVIHGPMVYEPAVAAAYVMQSADDPMRAAAAVARGYHARFPLTATEFDVLFDLIAVRLCTTVTLAAKQSAAEPSRVYLTVSEAGAWLVLEKLRDVDRDWAAEFFRDTCCASAAASDLS
ncbi:MAG: phosphotransferase [Chloroflexota bacterium]|nr:MAG: phosphotransferase [Chloroflexota bacterium]